MGDDELTCGECDYKGRASGWTEVDPPCCPNCGAGMPPAAMGDDERRQRAAAEKLENIFARQPYYFESATLTRDEVAAAQDIARGLLARLPPADDTEPVTEERLRAAGWHPANTELMAGVWFLSAPGGVDVACGASIVVSDRYGAVDFSGGLNGVYVTASKVESMGRLAHLLAALGVG